MARHDEADEDASPENYERFLLASHVDTRLVEFRAPDGRVVIVSLVDVLDDGLSCVYTFYDPDDPRAGLGTWSILWHIAQAQASGMPYVYLGYWIARSRKMAYKARFRPLEGYWRGRWLPFERIEPLFRTIP
jgi:arginine-tRNA-protein transferase